MSKKTEEKLAAEAPAASLLSFTLTVGMRVVVKANTNFHGAVQQVDPGGVSGYILLDADPEAIPPAQPERVYFHSDELDPE